MIKTLIIRKITRHTLHFVAFFRFLTYNLDSSQKGEAKMRDMTVGSPHSHLWRHALPLVLGNWMQLSYNAVDSMIAGRFIGKTALAAEGISGPVMNILLLAITGLCIGSGVLMSEAFGAGDQQKLKKTMANTLLFGITLCSIAALLGFLFSPQILHLLSVPDEISTIATAYLRVTFLGAPFSFCYNALAAALKSVGDAKTPLKFLAFSSILNAILDFIFLGMWGLGIICSAVTTVFAEAVSACLALWYMVRKVPQLLPQKAQWKTEIALLRQILRYGIPTALQQAIQPVGKVLIQGQVNALGVSSIAAFHAVTRVDDFACIPEQSISSAISTYIAQNRGAKKNKQVHPGFRCGILLEFCYWALICSIVFLFRTTIVSMFVAGDSAEDVIRFGSNYLGYMAFFYLFPAMTNGMQGFFRGMGKMYTTILGTLIQTSIRTVCTYYLAPRLGITGIAFSCAFGWAAMLLFEVPYYFHNIRKM